METIEKRKRGRPKGSTKITRVNPAESINPEQKTEATVIKPKVSIEDQRVNIQNWLNGSQNYTEGLHLLDKVTKRWRRYTKLLGQESKNKHFKLVHELNTCLKRIKSINSNNVVTAVKKKDSGE